MASKSNHGWNTSQWLLFNFGTPPGGGGVPKSLGGHRRDPRRVLKRSLVGIASTHKKQMNHWNSGMGIQRAPSPCVLTIWTAPNDRGGGSLDKQVIFFLYQIWGKAAVCPKRWVCWAGPKYAGRPGRPLDKAPPGQTAFFFGPTLCLWWSLYKGVHIYFSGFGLSCFRPPPPNLVGL